MGRALKYLVRLAVLAMLGLAAYALLADLPPPTRNVEVEIAVPPGGAPPPEPEAPAAPEPDAGQAPAPAAPAEAQPGVMQE